MSLPALGPTALSTVGEIRFFSDGQQPLVRVDTALFFRYHRMSSMDGMFLVTLSISN